MGVIMLVKILDMVDKLVVVIIDMVMVVILVMTWWT